MSTPVFDSDSRLLLVAPHPDDESLACAVALQRAVRADAAIRVIYVTDGDNNPWPQRVIESKWRLKAADRTRWGRIRRAEALTALRLLGVEPAATRFIGLPDQKLTTLLTRDCRFVLKRLASTISQWGPTHLIFPSHFDRHPDHSAVAVMIQLILPGLFSNGIRAAAWTYSVHGNSRAFASQAESMEASDSEQLTKLHAIRCHTTQLRLSSKRFLGYVSRPEFFISWREANAAILDDRSIRSITRRPNSLRLKLRIPMVSRALLAPTLLFVGRDNSGELRSARLQLPARASSVPMLDGATGRQVAIARYRGNALAGELTVSLLSCVRPVFVKLERRSCFFDQAGWAEVPAAQSESELLDSACVGDAAVAVR